MNDHKIAKLLNSVYLRELRGGKGPAAHYADLFMLIVLISAAVYLPVRLKFSDRGVATALTAIIAVIIFVFSQLAERIGLQRRIPKLRKRVSERLLRYKLLEDNSAICVYLRSCGVYAAESVEQLTSDDVLKAAGAGMRTIAYFGEPTGKAKELMEHFGIHSVSCIDLLPVERLALYAPDENEIDEALLKDIRIKKNRCERLKLIRPLSHTAAFRYICVGVLLMLLSFVVHARLYYRLIASASLFAGSAILTAKRIRSYCYVKEKPPAS